MGIMQSRKKRMVTIIVLAALILLVGGAVVVKSLSGNTSQPAPTPTPAATSSTDTQTETDADQTTKSETAVTPTVDPATLSSIAVEPLSINVFYTKGVPGFDFAVNRTTDGTQYVEFSNADLAGTKCTGDTGPFVTIIKNPSATALQTVTDTIKVGSDTYGLSLVAKDCTADTTLLDQYQTAFKNGFKSLTAL